MVNICTNRNIFVNNDLQILGMPGYSRRVGPNKVHPGFERLLDTILSLYTKMLVFFYYVYAL